MRAPGILACVLLCGCATSNDDTLVFSIRQALVTSGAGAAMADVVTGDWDRLCVFTTNAAAATIDSVTASAVRDPDRPAPADYSLLAFMRGEREEKTVRYPIEQGEFAAPGPEPWYCLTRDAAVFEMRSPIDGSIPWIGPVRRQ